MEKPEDEKSPKTPGEDVSSAIRRSFSARRAKSDLPSVCFGGESEHCEETENKQRQKKRKKNEKESGGNPRGKQRNMFTSVLLDKCPVVNLSSRD